MSTYAVVVEYATSRPPAAHGASRVLVEAESEADAWLTACAMVTAPKRGRVMVVSTTVEIVNL